MAINQEAQRVDGMSDIMQDSISDAMPDARSSGLGKLPPEVRHDQRLVHTNALI